MRDVGILIWVAFLIVGVLGSIVSSIRKQMQRSTQDGSRGVILSEAVRPSRRAQWVQQIAAQVAPPPPRVVAPPPSPPARRPVVAPSQPEPHGFSSPRADWGGRPRLLRDRKAIVQAVIAAEVLGKPRALRDEYL